MSNASKTKKPKKIRLLPSMKERKRYLVLVFKEKQEEEIKEIIEKAILHFVGTLGYAKSAPMIIKIIPKKSKTYALLSINRKYVDSVKAALALFSIPCVGVSGTIKKAHRFVV